MLTALDQRDARDAQVLLERAGIHANVLPDEDSAFSISVDSRDRTKAIELLAEAGLPRQPRSTVADLFPGDGFVVTPFEQKARLAFAVEQQLADTLSALDGVAAARVHVVLPEDNGRGLIREKARASALLQYRPGADLADIELKSRSILLNSIRGLASEDVSVISSPWSEIGLTASAARQALTSATTQPAAADKFASFGSLFSYRNLSILSGIVLAAAAGLLVIVPRRKESR
ncbi:type III secretion system inner membrane ring lipoprotein SctJ [Sinorhizobium psoraleae]|uniref:Lipoprotein n=1 Tax=Sinorhizobium psoraleae TaxID=520838 RepID=A0ABT4KP07_9HYPH|nr:type III secretion inner membrane ring lipoprotein SctJ [Sinorhizobium psoraleae]MCZ4093510.1 type III secretion inner membrane ring lipoprotein SctJ [Sinorhizobium psoraleae]